MLAALIAARRVSPVEVAEAHLRRIERVNTQLNAIVTLAPDVLERARGAEAEIMRGEKLGLLHGVPFTVKDTIETAGLRTTSGSKLQSTYHPQADATSVARLKASGAILLGKTNVPEMAIPYECFNPIFGRTNNPHDISKTAGGSSGGEAAAIGAFLSPAGLGSDLSGSIRVPAHFCGIAGLRPTATRIPASGHFPETVGPLLHGAVIGPMARSIEDLALLFKVLTRGQATSTELEKRGETGSVDLRGCRVGSFISEGLSPVTSETSLAVEAALGALSEAGLIVEAERPPALERAAGLWSDLYSRATVIQLRELYASNEEMAGPAVRAVLASAEKRLPSMEEVVAAQSERDSLLRVLVHWMKMTPLIVMPVGAVAAFEHDARRVEVSGAMVSVFHAFSYSRIANVLDLPSVTVPAGRTNEGLPIGVQILGRSFEDEAVLAAARIIEERLGCRFPPR